MNQKNFTLEKRLLPRRFTSRKGPRACPRGPNLRFEFPASCPAAILATGSHGDPFVHPRVGQGGRGHLGTYGCRPGTRWATRYGHGTRWATKISKPSRFAYPSRFRSRSRSRGVGKLPWLNLPAQKMSSYRDTANFGVRCHVSDVTPRVVGFGCMACRFLKPFSLRVTPGRFL